MTRPRIHIKKGDKVVVISGADKSDKSHEVLDVFADIGKVLVKDVNMRFNHTPRSQQNPQGARVRKECPIDASNLLLYSEKAGKGVRTAIQVVDGKKIRIGKPCGTKFD